MKRSRVDGSPLATIGLVADVQYADKPDHAPDGSRTRFYTLALSKLRSSICALNLTPLSAVIHLGDIVDGNTSSKATFADFTVVLRQFMRCQHPLLHVIGNHCHEVGRDTLLGQLQTAAYYERLLAPGVRIAVLDTTDMGVNGSTPELIAMGHAWLDANHQLDHANTWNGGVGSTQISWLRSIFGRARKAQERVLVAGHMPLLGAAASTCHLAFNHEEIAALLDEYCDVCPLYMCGHYHTGGYAQSMAGVRHITIEGVVEMRPEVECCHATLAVYPDRLVVDGGGGGVTSRELKLHRP